MKYYINFFTNFLKEKKEVKRHESNGLESLTSRQIFTETRFPKRYFPADDPIHLTKTDLPWSTRAHPPLDEYTSAVHVSCSPGPAWRDGPRVGPTKERLGDIFGLMSGERWRESGAQERQRSGGGEYSGAQEGERDLGEWDPVPTWGPRVVVGGVISCLLRCGLWD